MDSVKIDLPWPPSVNRYWRNVARLNRVLISKEGRVYRKLVGMLCLIQKVPRLEGMLEAHIIAYPPDKRRRDIDNICKGIFDSLERAGVYENDNQIKRLQIKIGEVKKGGAIELTLRKFGEHT